MSDAVKPIARHMKAKRSIIELCEKLSLEILENATVEVKEVNPE